MYLPLSCVKFRLVDCCFALLLTTFWYHAFSIYGDWVLFTYSVCRFLHRLFISLLGHHRSKIVNSLMSIRKHHILCVQGMKLVFEVFLLEGEILGCVNFYTVIIIQKVNRLSLVKIVIRYHLLLVANQKFITWFLLLFPQRLTLIKLVLFLITWVKRIVFKTYVGDVNVFTLRGQVDVVKFLVPIIYTCILQRFTFNVFIII